MPKKKKEFICELCDFKSFRASNYNKHLTTRKHQMRTNPSYLKANKKAKSETLCVFEEDGMLENKPINGIYYCICGKKYKHLSSLSYHKKDCPKVIKKLETESKDKMFDQIIRDTSDLKKMMHELIPKITTNTQNIKNITNVTNNTNNFNISVFLNESCKDAINMTEFVANLDVGDKELEFAKNNGIVEGVSSVIVNNLNNLEVTKRPIHCTDVDKKILYVKDEDNWDKNGKNIVSKSIHDVKNKHINAIKSRENNNCQENKDSNPEFISLIKQASDDTVNKDEDKIIENISKEVEISDQDNIIQIK